MTVKNFVIYRTDSQQSTEPCSLQVDHIYVGIWPDGIGLVGQGGPSNVSLPLKTHDASSILVFDQQSYKRRKNEYYWIINRNVFKTSRAAKDCLFLLKKGRQDGRTERHAVLTA